MEKTTQISSPIEEAFHKWKEQFRKSYPSLTPTLEDAFRGGCLSILPLLPRPYFSKEDVDAIIAEADRAAGGEGDTLEDIESLHDNVVA